MTGLPLSSEWEYEDVAASDDGSGGGGEIVLDASSEVGPPGSEGLSNIHKFRRKKPEESNLLHSCKVCGKKVTALGRLAQHMKLHSEERPSKKHVCEICSKRFAHKGDLNRHLRVHTGDKPFKCDICHRQFTQSSHKKSHKCLELF